MTELIPKPESEDGPDRERAIDRSVAVEVSSVIALTAADSTIDPTGIGAAPPGFERRPPTNCANAATKSMRPSRMSTTVAGEDG